MRGARADGLVPAAYALVGSRRLQARGAPSGAVVLHATALAALGEPDRARTLVRPVTGSPGTDPAVAVDARLVAATAAARHGATEEAREALRHARSSSRR